MLISTRTSYSIRALYELALNYGIGPVSISYMVEKQQIPETYLEQLLFLLKGADLVTGIRGINGGYILKREPEQISLADILKVTEGEQIISKCLMTGDTCSVREVCPAHDILIEMQDEFFKQMSKISLRDVVDRKKNTLEGETLIEENLS